MKEEVFKYFTENNKSGWKMKEKNLKNDNMVLYENLINYNKLIKGDVTFTELIYMYVYEILEKPKCECGNNVLFLDIKRGFQKFCSRSCSNKSIKTKEVLKNSLKNKYGVTNVNKLETVKEKKKSTNLKKYGVENVFENKDIQEKIKETNLEKYGVEKIVDSLEIKEKIKQTNLEKYNYVSPLSSPIIHQKRKSTNLKKYGVENVFENKDIQEKIKETNLEKYGVENILNNTDIQEKIKETNLEKYGCEYPLGLEKIREKIKQTNIKKYGVENPINNINVRKKMREKFKGGKSIGESILQNKLQCERSYFYSGKEFDLKYGNYIIEIDGNFWHVDKIENLSYIQLNNLINDKEKEDIIKNSEFDFIRIRYNNIKNINTFDDLLNLSYIKDYTFTNNTIIMNKEYILKYNHKIQKYFYIFKKFLTIFDINDYNLDKLKNILGINGSDKINDFTINNIR